MKHLRQSITLLLVISLLILYVESLSNNTNDRITIVNSSNFFLILSSLSALILLPFWGRFSTALPLSIWALFFLLIKFVESRQTSLTISTVQIYIAEFAVLALLIFLAHRVNQLLAQFESAATDLALDDHDLQNYYLTRDLANEHIRMEFTRAREGDRPLSLLLIEPDAQDRPLIFSKLLDEVQRHIVSRYSFLQIARVLHTGAPKSNLIVQEKNQRLIMLCPEADAEASNRLLQQMGTALQNQLDINVKRSSATFPEEGFTFDGLIASAEEKLSTLATMTRTQGVELTHKKETTPSLSSATRGKEGHRTEIHTEFESYKINGSGSVLEK